MRTKSCIHTLVGHTNTVADLRCQGVEPQVKHSFNSIFLIFTTGQLQLLNRSILLSSFPVNVPVLAPNANELNHRYTSRFNQETSEMLYSLLILGQSLPLIALRYLLGCYCQSRLHHTILGSSKWKIKSNIDESQKECQITGTASYTVSMPGLHKYSKNPHIRTLYF